MIWLSTKTKKPAKSTICRLLVCFEIDLSGLYGTNLEPFSDGFEAVGQFVSLKNSITLEEEESHQGTVYFFGLFSYRSEVMESI